MERIYLGDGAYASFDGAYLWLETDRGGVTHRVALDGSAFTALARLAEQEWPGILDHAKGDTR